VAIERTLSEGTRSQRRSWIEIHSGVFCYVADRRDGREWHAAQPGVKNAGPLRLSSLQCSESKALVLGMFSHYLLFDPE